jgi:uncharacterized protein
MTRTRAASPASVRVSVRAKPRASRSRIGRASGLEIEASLAAAPVDGAANTALIELLSEALSLRASALRLVLGQTSKHKVVEVSGLSEQQVVERLAAAATKSSA